MKRIFTIFLALVLVYAFTVPAYALENIFGGTWRTRAFSEMNYSGDDTGSQDLARVDTRTQLSYTAKFSDNFQFVNRFRIDSKWGDSGSGPIGTGAMDIKVRRTYVDFTLAPVNLKIGAQPFTLARGFIIDDDAFGATVVYKLSDAISVPFIWIKGNEGGTNANYFDVDYYGIAPSIKIDKATVSPYFLLVTSRNASDWTNTIPVDGNVTYKGAPAWLGSGFPGFEKLNMYYLGLDVDATAGPASVWFTGIYQGGSADVFGTDTNVKFKGYLAAIGGSADVKPLSVHGQAFYASGQDANSDSNDIKAFWAPDLGDSGQSYLWAQIMGAAIFDNQGPKGLPSGPDSPDHPTDIMALNLGVSMKVMPKLDLTGDVWYAKKAKKDINGETALGTELDLVATYSVLDNLSLDLIGAYLFAGNGLYNGSNSKNPALLGSRLSFSF